MATPSAQTRSRLAWRLTRRQHGVVTHRQLLELGMSPAAIRHRLRRGRLHPVLRGAYAVGRPEVGEKGRWMAAVLTCGPRALLSHRSAAALWGIAGPGPAEAEVVVAPTRSSRCRGVRVHRRRDHEAPGRRVVDGIPVTHPIATLVDLAASEPQGRVEAAVNEADHLDLVDPEHLLAAVCSLPRWAGTARLRRLLERPTVALTSTELERRFLPLAIAAGLPVPRTQAQPSGYRVDFFWPDLGLVVEADSLRYHRTPFKQARDTRRDNAHAGSGLTTLRFTHGQICHEPDYVRRTLVVTARRLVKRSCT